MHVYRDVLALTDLAVDERQVFAVVEAAAVAHGGERAEGCGHRGLHDPLHDRVDPGAGAHGHRLTPVSTMSLGSV